MAYKQNCFHETLHLKCFTGLWICRLLGSAVLKAYLQNVQKSICTLVLFRVVSWQFSHKTNNLSKWKPCLRNSAWITETLFEKMFMINDHSCKRHAENIKQIFLLRWVFFTASKVFVFGVILVFLTFSRIQTEYGEIFLRIQYECGKMREKCRPE